MNEPSTPTEIIRHICRLIEQERWGEVGQWADPIALASWREQHLRQLRALREAQPAMTAEQYRSHDPEMPLEVAQWMADRANRAAREQRGDNFGGAGTIAELLALEATELFGRMLEARDPRTQARQTFGDSQPELAAVISEEPFDRHEVIGEIIVGDTAYVTFLIRYQVAGSVRPSVAVLRRTRGAWRALTDSPLFDEGGGSLFSLESSESVRRPLSVRQMPWVDRRFNHELTPEHFPALLERFRGTPARVATLGWMPASLRTARQDGRWSIQEHIGHLLDLEALGEQRLDDFRGRVPTLTAADLTNRTTHEANHNRAEWWELIQAFTGARETLVAGLEALTADVIAHKAIHPRLKRPMNVPEWVFFMCEHDDHHLAVVRAISDQWQADFLEGSATVNP